MNICPNAKITRFFFFFWFPIFLFFLLKFYLKCYPPTLKKKFDFLILNQKNILTNEKNIFTKILLFLKNCFIIFLNEVLDFFIKAFAQKVFEDLLINHVVCQFVLNSLLQLHSSYNRKIRNKNDFLFVYCM